MTVSLAVQRRTERIAIMSTDAQDGAQHSFSSFADPEAVARHPEGPQRFAPGFDALHLMTGTLLAERAPSDATVLVLGAGGGLEKAMAEAHPSWRFVGVDPSEEMLKLAARTPGPLVERAELVQGHIEDAPAGPFDAATCLLTLRVAASRPSRTRRGVAGVTRSGHCVAGLF